MCYSFWFVVFHWNAKTEDDSAVEQGCPEKETATEAYPDHPAEKAFTEVCDTAP